MVRLIAGPRRLKLLGLDSASDESEHVIEAYSEPNHTRHCIDNFRVVRKHSCLFGVVVVPTEVHYPLCQRASLSFEFLLGLCVMPADVVPSNVLIRGNNLFVDNELHHILHRISFRVAVRAIDALDRSQLEGGPEKRRRIGTVIRKREWLMIGQCEDAMKAISDFQWGRRRLHCCRRDTPCLVLDHSGVTEDASSFDEGSGVDDDYIIIIIVIIIVIIKLRRRRPMW